MRQGERMDDRVKATVRDLTEALEQERITFPDAVQALIEAGVERCHADFAGGTTTWYMADGSLEITRSRVAAAGLDFRGDLVREAIRAVEQREVGYRAFCDRLAAAGCIGYFVSLAGRRSVHYGRTMAAHVEWFGPPPGFVPAGAPPSRHPP
jgi:uncharacterized protein YbcV (DUF1398 family)